MKLPILVRAEKPEA